MIAKVLIQLPLALTIPENESFPPIDSEREGYKIRFYPLVRSENADKHTGAETVTINGRSSFNVDTLKIYFHKESFSRDTESGFDPPEQLISDIANDFLLRLRCVTGGFNIKPLNMASSNLRLEYLNDDETELMQQKGFIRGRGARVGSFSIIGVTSKTWEDIHKLNPNNDLPIWKTLLFDANAILPEVGPAIVLTFTALEVFIAKTLDDVAQKIKLDSDLWKWVNDRGFFLKNPSIEEQFDFLCRHLIGGSIKEDSKLWEAFKNIQAARNSFAHTGIPSFGGKLVDEKKAIEFISKANEITNFIKKYLPEELKWAEFKNELKIEANIQVFKPAIKKEIEEK